MPRPSRSPTRRRLVGHRRRRRCTTPSSEAPIGLFAGGEQPPGIPTAFLPFLLCEAERPNPNLTLFGYLMSPNFELFAKFIRCTCVHPCPFSGSASARLNPNFCMMFKSFDDCLAASHVLQYLSCEKPRISVINQEKPKKLDDWWKWLFFLCN